MKLTKRCPHCREDLNLKEISLMVRGLMHDERVTVARGLMWNLSPDERFTFIKDLIEEHTNEDDKLSLRGFINASFRKSIGREGGRKPDTTQERCPCGTNTLKRAKVRSFDCCKARRVPIPADLIGQIDKDLRSDRFHRYKGLPDEKIKEIKDRAITRAQRRKELEEARRKEAGRYPDATGNQ